MATTVGIQEPSGLVMARWVVERGGHVLPCYINKDLDKYPLVRGGVNAGTRDVSVVEGWWDRYPYAAVGVSSRVGGWICFDCDGPQARDWFYQLAVDTCGGGPDAFAGGLVYESPGRSGGAHWWFRWNPEIDAFHSAKVRGSVGEVQLRGVGCWSLLPCKRADGEYRTLNAPVGELAVLPLSLYRAFMEVVSAQPVVVGEGGLGDLREVSPERAWALGPLSDNRKTVLAGLCWYLAIRSDDSDEYWETVRRFNDEVCAPSLEWGIVERKAVYTWQRAQAAREKLAKEAEGYQKLIGKLFV